MSHSGKPFAALIIGGLGVIFLLLAGSVWSQVAYDHFSYLPSIARRDTPTPTLTPTSWINCSLKGQVRVAVTPLTLVPLVGATVGYTHTSYISGSGHSGITLTNASGQYAFAPLVYTTPTALEFRRKPRATLRRCMPEMPLMRASMAGIAILP